MTILKNIEVPQKTLHKSKYMNHAITRVILDTSNTICVTANQIRKNNIGINSFPSFDYR